jgi:ribonuclease P protein component
VRKRPDFLRIQKLARRVTCAHFLLLVAEQAGLTVPARLGIVVTKKVGSAVSRNRIKRLCRECFRTFPGLLPDGVDLVVIAREGAETLSLAEVRAEWTRARAQLTKRAQEALVGKGVARPRDTTHVSPGHAAKPRPERT